MLKPGKEIQEPQYFMKSRPSDSDMKQDDDDANDGDDASSKVLAETAANGEKKYRDTKRRGRCLLRMGRGTF